MNVYLEEVEGVGDPELHLFSVHRRRIVHVELHQVLRLIDGAELHERLRGSQHVLTLTTQIIRVRFILFCLST